MELHLPKVHYLMNTTTRPDFVKQLAISRPQSVSFHTELSRLNRLCLAKSAVEAFINILSPVMETITRKQLGPIWTCFRYITKFVCDLTLMR